MNVHLSEQPLVLENARVVLLDRVLKNGSVVVESGLITAVAEVSVDAAARPQWPPAGTRHSLGSSTATK